MLTRAVIVALALGSFQAWAECPNACSGNGDCGQYDQCDCFANFQGNDCSEMTCPFGLSHVDTPKGDLDADNTVSGPTLLKVSGAQVYPAGTTEQFPAMETGNAPGADTYLPTRVTTDSNTGHAYMECSNKGLCNRKTATCECFDGYEGSACQRASCPNDCSGHGLCMTIQQLAQDTYNNEYQLWDKDATMGCKCDTPYTGPDCSLKQCKYGVDPLYNGNNLVTAKYNVVNLEVLSDIGAGTSASGYTDSPLGGSYAIRFYDVFGEDYVTAPISATAGCTEVQAALHALPNTVIPADSVTCSATANALHGSGAAGISGVDPGTLELSFTGNPGKLRQIEVDTNLNGDASTLTGYNPAVRIYSDGNDGEFIDYFASDCDVTVNAVSSTWTSSSVKTPTGDVTPIATIALSQMESANNLPHPASIDLSNSGYASSAGPQCLGGLTACTGTVAASTGSIWAMPEDIYAGAYLVYSGAGSNVDLTFGVTSVNNANAISNTNTDNTASPIIGKTALSYITGNNDIGSGYAASQSFVLNLADIAGPKTATSHSTLAQSSGDGGIAGDGTGAANPSMMMIVDRVPGYPSSFSVGSQTDAQKLNSCLGDADGDGTVFTVDQFDDATTDDTGDPADTPFRRAPGSNGGIQLPIIVASVGDSGTTTTTLTVSNYADDGPCHATDGTTGCLAPSTAGANGMEMSTSPYNAIDSATFAKNQMVWWTSLTSNGYVYFATGPCTGKVTSLIGGAARTSSGTLGDAFSTPAVPATRYLADTETLTWDNTASSYDSWLTSCAMGNPNTASGEGTATALTDLPLAFLVKKGPDGDRKNPHAVKINNVFYLIFIEEGIYQLNYKTINVMQTGSVGARIYGTDAVVKQVFTGRWGLSKPARAIVQAFTNVITVNEDVSCETASATLVQNYDDESRYINAPHKTCLERGDMIMLPDDGSKHERQDWKDAAYITNGVASPNSHDGASGGSFWSADAARGTTGGRNSIAANTGGIYTIEKIYMAKPTMIFPDYTCTIVLDKNVNWGAGVMGRLAVNQKPVAGLDPAAYIPHSFSNKLGLVQTATVASSYPLAGSYVYLDLDMGTDGVSDELSHGGMDLMEILVGIPTAEALRTASTPTSAFNVIAATDTVKGTYNSNGNRNMDPNTIMKLTGSSCNSVVKLDETEGFVTFQNSASAAFTGQDDNAEIFLAVKLAFDQPLINHCTLTGAPYYYDGLSVTTAASGTPSQGYVKAEIHGGSFTSVMYKFTPAETGNYEYVSQCSNRGTCDSDTGLCKCFKGYTGDACDLQAALAI